MKLSEVFLHMSRLNSFAVGHRLCKNKYFGMDYSWLLGKIYQKQIKMMI